MIAFLIKGAILAALVCAAGYGLWNSLIRVRADEGVIIEDYRRGRIVGFYGEGTRFFWQGLLPFLYHVQILPVENVRNWEITVSIPGLERSAALNTITIPVQVVYTIKPGKVTDLQMLLSGGQKLDSAIKNSFESLLSLEIHGIINARYSRDAVLTGMESFVGKTLDRVKNYYSLKGIEMISAEARGVVRLPGDGEYARALFELSEIDRVKLENEKSFLSVQERIREGRLLNGELFAKLREMSLIIRDNPDILKYIYIDKMSDNVKIIISSDRTGLPMALDGEFRDSGPDPSKRREIDNLR